MRRAEDAGVSLRESFEHFDADRSGELDEHELQRGLRALGMELSMREVRDGVPRVWRLRMA